MFNYGLKFLCIFKFSNSNPICIICTEKVHAAGAFHASQSKLNSEHAMKLTNNWKDTAVYIGDNELVNRLMIGDLGANSSFYHKRCSTNLYKANLKKLFVSYHLHCKKKSPWRPVRLFLPYLN